MEKKQLIVTISGTDHRRLKELAAHTGTTMSDMIRAHVTKLTAETIVVQPPDEMIGGKK